MNLTWNDLMRTGAIVGSTISIWTARTAMRAEDFDVTDSEELRKAVNLGIARLVPRKSMAEIRAAANEFQSIIDGAGVEFSAIRGSRFVQNEQIPRTVERANAVELLDNLLPGTLKHKVVPLLERYGGVTVPARGVGRMTPDEALRWVAGAGDPWLAACDVGGFGLGDASDLSFRVTARLRWTLSDHVDLLAGWSMLDVDYEIACRTGLHCAPLLHKQLGTEAVHGAVRLSVGPFNTMAHIETAVGAVREIARSRRPGTTGARG